MDTNQGIDVRNILPRPFEWCLIEAGSIELVDMSELGGSNGGRFEVGTFWIAKYPITNGQYQVFVLAGDGYRNEGWWDFSDEGAQWRKDNPEARTTVNVGDDLPQTSVSWYDTIAFCRWLSFKASIEITLPTEQQWQRAALGDTDWVYPWGDEIDETRCNYDMNEGQSTPVTQYDKGASPYGVYDLSGNIWEWTLTDWVTGSNVDIRTKDVLRVLRGGGWGSDRSIVTARYRIFTPRNLHDRLGFRVCCPHP